MRVEDQQQFRWRAVSLKRRMPFLSLPSETMFVKFQPSGQDQWKKLARLHLLNWFVELV